MFWQNKATQAVPSACSKWPPVGNGALRSKTPILSRPRNPPSKRLRPKRSLRFTHQPKFDVSLPNIRLRKSRSVWPRTACSMRNRKIVDRRVDIAEIPLVGRDLPGRMQVRLAEQEVEL